MSEHGKPLFTPEEIEAEKAEKERRKKEYEEELANGFQQHQISRRCVIDRIDKEAKVSKAGKNYTLHTYHLRDCDTGQEETLVDRDFAFTNGFKDVKLELGTAFVAGVTVIDVYIEKVGEREYNGVKYPNWSYRVALDGTGTKPPAPKPTAELGDEPPF